MQNKYLSKEFIDKLTVLHGVLDFMSRNNSRHKAKQWRDLSAKFRKIGAVINASYCDLVADNMEAQNENK